MLDQLGEGGKSIHELDRQRRRLQVEIDELQAALEENKVELQQVLSPEEVKTSCNICIPGETGN